MSYLFCSNLRNSKRNPKKKAAKDARWKRNLAVPADRKYPELNASAVGEAGAKRAAFDDDYYMQVYALNKDLCPDPSYAVEFGLVRAEAVRLGWGDGSYETDYVESDLDAKKVFESDKQKINAKTPSAKRAAWLIPMVSEFVLRTVGHHYVFENESLYRDAHDSIMKACNAQEVTRLMPRGLLYYSVLHWTGYMTPYKVAGLHTKDDVLPKALVKRHTYLPPAPALITFVAQVGKHMGSNGYTYDGQSNFETNMKKVIRMAEIVRKDPIKYHPYSGKYKITPMHAAEQTEFDDVKEAAIQMAPVARAFVAVVMPSSYLIRAKQLKTAADRGSWTFTAAKREFTDQQLQKHFDTLDI
ncbi:hypothetical protein FBU59_000062 [Linderina macrospora]|uniref:Uncharacterized protein n=1 Tax=Linderina macrospora TaxID=4868 RepID=A0ACC1JI75_9FUNG|nr:hypothetical protein FBU59_000062 [Linderina macrospora]